MNAYTLQLSEIQRFDAERIETESRRVEQLHDEIAKDGHRVHALGDICVVPFTYARDLFKWERVHERMLQVHGVRT